MAKGAMVASAHPLGTAAGLEVLRRGGNAMDAAIAVAAVTGVVLPSMAGLGGDTFLIHYEAKTGKVEALNGSGISPYGASLEYYRSQGYRDLMPLVGPLSVAVPGTPHAMATALARWGSWSLADVLQPAVKYARHGFPVSEILADHFSKYKDKLALFPETATVWLKEDGSTYRAGEILCLPDYADSLERFAQEGIDFLYRGYVAEQIASLMQNKGGLLGLDELANHQSEIYRPLSIDYRGYRIYQTSPPSQGLIMLEQLGILSGYDLASLGPRSPAAIHLMVEAKKLAYADRLAFLGDPRLVDAPIALLLNPAYMATRRQSIDQERASAAVDAGDPDGDTTSFVVIDRVGNAVSYIHSLSLAFGSGLTVPDTGILLNNRAGRGFVLDAAHPNCLAPGKKTMHTLNTFLVTSGGKLYLLGNTPGGDGQPQWNMQSIINCIDFNMSVHEAVTWPRWTSMPGTDPAALNQPLRLRLENRFEAGIISRLQELGHDLDIVDAWAGGGAMQMIMIDPKTGVRYGASDPRGDGTCLGF